MLKIKNTILLKQTFIKILNVINLLLKILNYLILIVKTIKNKK
jgi:hypothetical protein